MSPVTIQEPSFVSLTRFSPEAGVVHNPSLGAALTPEDVLLIRHLSLQGVPLQEAVSSVLGAKLLDPGAFQPSRKQKEESVTKTTGLFERVTNSPSRSGVTIKTKLLVHLTSDFYFRCPAMTVELAVSPTNSAAC
jgi:hypothetical protein